MADGNSSWVLPDKFTDDLLDEHGNKMSKRCGIPYTCIGIDNLLVWYLGKRCFPSWIVCQT